MFLKFFIEGCCCSRNLFIMVKFYSFLGDLEIKKNF